MLAGCTYSSDVRTAIFRSRDGGKTFDEIDVTQYIQVHGSGDGKQCGEAIAVDPDNPNISYCGGDVAAGDAFEEKYGVLPANAEATANDDGTLSIVLTDASGNVLDTYIIAPETGIGKDSSGAEVNLPQTGNNSMGTLMTASGAVLLVFAGIFVMMKSGVIRRRKEEE
ncbi:LPXTG cell wall anchor domain-containing protein [uncultured Ruminococcus sp.]|uniref:LPXTG cell wall anchor domain-containing protein n=1 Tax=uncultured Ruminococcus sp. TaxID=165186 RepID=UPI00263613F5|nr:LPXTG cell wall anchor domain-containing protein [uncultured Ruminococcus sp.]